MTKFNGTNIEFFPANTSKASVIQSILNARNIEVAEDAFYIGDIGDIIAKYDTWMKILPDIEPFYAVKCNDNRVVLKTMADLGCSFDCASKLEIDRVLKLGVSPTRIVFANPVKQTSFIRHARKKGIDLMTFDNETELHKIKTFFPSARLILRVLPPNDFKVQCELGMKFGCPLPKAQHLLSVARDLQLHIVGISFHVGSGCKEAEAYAAAIREASTVFSVARNMFTDVHILDIGGGFPGQPSAAVPFIEIADVIKSSLKAYFPEEWNVRVIAEPGRYFVASAFTLVTNVISKRVVCIDNPNSAIVLDDVDEKDMKNSDLSFMYYINDGVYGAFNCILYDHATVCPTPLAKHENTKLYPSSVWGPTCDGLDCVMKEVLLPIMASGSWLYFEDMGAYTMSAASNFNGMPTSRCYFFMFDNLWSIKKNNREVDLMQCQALADVCWHSDSITRNLADLSLTN